MEGHCSTGQSPKWAVALKEEEEECYRQVRYGPQKLLYFHAAIHVYCTVKNIFWWYNPKVGYAVAQLVEALRYKS